jgi:hypothetical protein
VAGYRRYRTVKDDDHGGMVIKSVAIVYVLLEETPAISLFDS